MKGVIHLYAVNGCTVEENTFEFNDCHHIYNYVQDVGIITNIDAHYGHVQRASILYVDEYTNNVEVKENVMRNNTLDFNEEMIRRENADLCNFYPPYYHKSSTAVFINIYQTNAH